MKKSKGIKLDNLKTAKEHLKPHLETERGLHDSSSLLVELFEDLDARIEKDIIRLVMED